MKLIPCLLLLCTLSMTAGIPLAADPQTNHTHDTHENHHRYAHHNVIAEHSSHNEGRNLLVSMFLVPKAVVAPKVVIAAPKITIKVPKSTPKSKKPKPAIPKITIKVATPVVAAPKPNPVTDSKITVKVAAPVVAAAAAPPAFKISAVLNDWLKTSVGASAAAFCSSLGIQNNDDVYSGCLEDMRVTKSEDIAKESAVTAMEFASKDNVASPSNRFCVASGDPHCTNYDGDFFHIQEPGIYTIATSRDGVFEVQEKMRKNGADKVGVPSCMTGALVHYKQISIEADVANFKKLRVNGVEMDLKQDETVKFGGVTVRYGKQNVEWHGVKDVTMGLKMSTPEGFGALIIGGYCGVLETSVPTTYYGRMGGICGNADGAKNAADYFSPSGEIMNVNRGAKQWEMTGYNGPTSPLSKWQLAWKPIGSRCYFAAGCEAGPTNVVSPVAVKVSTPVVAAPVVAPVAVKVDKPVVAAPVVAPVAVKVDNKPVVAAPVVAPVAVKVDNKPVAAPVVVPVVASVAAPTKVVPVAASVAAPVAVKVDTPVVVSPTASSTSSHSSHSHSHSSASSDSSRTFATSKDDVIGNVNNMHTRIVSIIHETQTLQKREIDQNKRNVNISQTDLDKFMAKQDEESKLLLKLQASILQTNASIIAHYAQMNADSLYLHKLDLIKPLFLQTLDSTNANFAALSDHVSKLVSDEHKKAMLDILARARNATVYDTRDLAQAFLAHYEKYKNVLRTESNSYSQDFLNLKDLTQRYASGQTTFSGLKAEVARLRDLVASLKKGVGASEADAAMFVQIEKIISEILSSKKTKFVTDGANKECAVSVLKSHVANGLV